MLTSEVRKIRCTECGAEYELVAENLPFLCPNCRKRRFWLLEGWMPNDWYPAFS